MSRHIRGTTEPATDPAGAGLAPALEFEGVTKRYGPNVVVDGLSFVVRPGRVTGFLGPNGSGKSTTMKILLDLASADRGRASIGGRRYRDLRDPAQTVGVVLEPNAFHPGRSGRNHLRVIADATGVPLARTERLIEDVGLGSAADRHVGAYSLGMQQRLALAAALLGDPPVLVLDEPGNGLDPQGIRVLRELLRARAARGHTVLVSSHLLAEMEHLADDVVVINRGRLVTSGPLRDLQESVSLVRSDAPERLSQALREAGAEVRSLDDGALEVRSLAMEDVGEHAFRAGVVLHQLTPRAGSLEDLFLGWTGDGGSTPTRPAPEGVVRP